jgi:prephenate dehydratase
MKKIIYGIQGGKGSFNEQAITEYTSKRNIKDYEVKYLYTTDKVLDALTKGEIDFGLFAIDNSVGGLVEESIYAMGKYIFNIVEEFSIIIAHFLMKPKNIDIKEIDTIMTHPQVLKQCKSTLKKKYPNLKQISGDGEMIDHAVVARKMSEGEIDKNVAVMGPEILSKMYDLDVIEGNLQDNKENWTSFLLVSR